MVKLSKDQKLAQDTLLEWYEKGTSSYITLGGYAGTGKTTLIASIRKHLHTKNKKLQVAFCAFTGKATSVLKRKLFEQQAVFEKDFVCTLHSLIYTPIEDEKGIIVGWKKHEGIRPQLIIVDEASMIYQELWNDLLSFNIKIIAVGDHGQLPPPVSNRFNLMQEPELRLEAIHRQARDNPIIKLSALVRNYGEIPYGNHDDKVYKYRKYTEEGREVVNHILQEKLKETLVLCGTNKTRVEMNKYIRGLQNRSEFPEIGDKVICLRNNQKSGIYNGMIGYVKDISDKNKNWYKADVLMENDYLYSGDLYKDQFYNQQSLNFTPDRIKSVKGDLFDFGYCITVHKAQGSQSKRVVLLEERFRNSTDEDWSKWLYTAITRAEEEVYIIA